MIESEKQDNLRKDKLGIYIHIPFCEKKCNYCDFVSYDAIPGSAPKRPFSQGQKNTYIECLQNELCIRAKSMQKEYRVDSIYYGGGTPTTVNIDALKALNNDIFSLFCMDRRIECSIEANPETVCEQKVMQMNEAGFNRVSLGIQSLDDGVLMQLGRIHDARKAEESYGIVRKHVDNVNVDVMFGLPGQTLAIWKDTLRRVLSWEPAHISFYSLQIEEGTPFYAKYRSDVLDIPDWTENRAMYHFAVQTIKEAGYHHYEISNAAKPGYECVHNLKYWTMQEYMGLGVSAHSYIEEKRVCNPSSWNDYMQSAKNNFSQQTIAVPQSRKENIGDYFFTELRLLCGFSLSDYRERFGADFLVEYKDAWTHLTTEGLLERQDGYIKLSQKGLDYTNPVMEVLLNA